jgi:hypothetical protein
MANQSISNLQRRTEREKYKKRRYEVQRKAELYALLHHMPSLGACTSKACLPFPFVFYLAALRKITWYCIFGDNQRCLICYQRAIMLR